MAIEQTILSNLIHNEEYMRKVFPFLKEEYFSEHNTKIIFKHVSEFINKYNTNPSKDALEIAFHNDKNIPEDMFSDVMNMVNDFEKEDVNLEWAINETEKYCKDRAVYNAIVTSISILDGRDKVHAKDGIPSLLQEALGVCFDTSIGHDYIDDALERYDFYNRVEDRIPFDLAYFNAITKDGLPRKTLNIALAGTGVGKSLFMCHVAAGCLKQSKNVLYITLEMAEERIAERIDANLMDTAIDELKDIPKSTFENRVKRITDKTQGRLIIKEYPTASAHVGHFKALLNELSLKRNFKPDIIFIDYLNICSSARFKPSSNVNSYMMVKSIAEELRGLAVEYNLPIVSATQTTRGGYGNTDVELTDTSESFGLPATADFMFALISTEDLEKMGQIMVKQLKNRYNDPSLHKRFLIGVDRAKMKLFDLEQSAQTNIHDSGKQISSEDIASAHKRQRDSSKYNQIRL
jgi:archaellum biogenesis ATPase FlaH